MFRTRLPLTASLISAIFLSALAPLSTTFAHAAAPEFSNCLLTASTNQLVSLGSPMASERLSHKTNIRIGVLPIYFNNSEVKVLSEYEKKDYLSAASVIRQFSNNLVSVQIVFLESFKIDKPMAALKQAFSERNQAWSDQSTDKGTWGFVRQVVQAADSTRNFSNLDGIILESNNSDRSFSIAEAMGFYRGQEGNVYRYATADFFKSITTQDGILDNAILLDFHQGVNTIAHELMHNFGLTDLYGSGAGPADLSIMAVGSLNILNYEKAVLGWFPVANFKCKNLQDVLNANTVENVVELTNIKENSIFLLKKSDDVAYIVEVVNFEGKSQLIVYLLEQDRRPPITASYGSGLNYPNFYDIRDPKFIGSKYRTEDFDLLITNKTNDAVTLNLIPIKLANSAESKSILEKSILNRELANAKAKAAAEADAKARAEAEADAKAKAEAEANAKAKTEPKKSTITCIKRKITKKVTGLNPKCPAGFKKK